MYFYLNREEPDAHLWIGSFTSAFNRIQPVFMVNTWWVLINNINSYLTGAVSLWVCSDWHTLRSVTVGYLAQCECCHSNFGAHQTAITSRPIEKVGVSSCSEPAEFMWLEIFWMKSVRIKQNKYRLNIEQWGGKMHTSQEKQTIKQAH